MYDFFNSIKEMRDTWFNGQVDRLNNSWFCDHCSWYKSYCDWWTNMYRKIFNISE